ncbi:hypothetical protein VTK56DRAFT_8110 [Thermocarpiscus australiensis]
MSRNDGLLIRIICLSIGFSYPPLVGTRRGREAGGGQNERRPELLPRGTTRSKRQSRSVDIPAPLGSQTCALDDSPRCLDAVLGAWPDRSYCTILETGTCHRWILAQTLLGVRARSGISVVSYGGYRGVEGWVSISVFPLSLVKKLPSRLDGGICPANDRVDGSKILSDRRNSSHRLILATHQTHVGILQPPFLPCSSH